MVVIRLAKGNIGNTVEMGSEESNSNYGRRGVIGMGSGIDRVLVLFCVPRGGGGWV